jgi:hypothetical protein
MSKKLNSADIISHMQNGALLKKTYCVYSYWSLILTDGTIIYNLTKGAPQTAKSKISYDIIQNDKDCLTIKMR